MRIRTIVLASALAAALSGTGSAFAPHKGSDTPITAAGSRQPRLHRSVGSSAPASARMGSLGTWHQIWDRDTDVPLRMWGPSIAYFASTANAATAELAAEQFLAAHLDVLAPGSVPTDFVVVANQLDPSGHIRTVGFQQYANGVRVEGGGIGITFERDRLVMVGSTALPNVSVRMPTAALAPATIEASAQAFLASDAIGTHVRSHGERVIVPMIFERGTKPTVDIAYRVAETVSLEADREAGRWDVWVDATDGAAIARKATLMFASGTVKFDVPDRYPGGTRTPRPAPLEALMINGVGNQTDANGLTTFTGASPATVIPSVTGPFVAVTNFGGALVSDSLQLTDGGTVTWSHASDPATDAQLDAFVYASQAKAFVRSRINPGLGWLDGQLSATVNEAAQDSCNAYSTGDDIHFYPQKVGTCENTGRIADVVYHEFGHSVHANSIIDGEGAFDSSLSEGLADTLAVSITGDHGMGRGFFFTDAALRDVDPVGIEKKWPDDADGEPHDEGEIIGEALYDLRKAMQDKYGVDAGFTKFLPLYYGVMQRAADIPSSYAAVLLADDDDGDVSNGVPDQCAINTTFAAHGLYSAAQLFQGSTPPVRTGNSIALTLPVQGGNTDCPPPTVASVTLTYQTRGASAATELALTASGTTYSGAIPAQAAGAVTLYHVTVALSDGSKVQFPDNPADPDYQMFTGTATMLQCFDFEDGLQGWTHSGLPTNRDEWQAGTPMGLGGDPTAAFAGTGELGTDLSTDGQYRGGAKTWAISPAIDLQGHTNVHLQYYRWLDVEDGAYDQAMIFANTTQVWTNFTSPGMPTAGVNHTDKEWGFHDVDLTAAVTEGTPLTLKYEIDSDRGLNMAGWNVDNVCLVAYDAANPALCGNGAIDTGETCDDGNTTDGDGCSSTCQSDDGATADGGGCCSIGGDPKAAIGLSLLTLGLVIRRRRRA